MGRQTYTAQQNIGVLRDAVLALLMHVRRVACPTVVPAGWLASTDQPSASLRDNDPMRSG